MADPIGGNGNRSVRTEASHQSHPFLTNRGLWLQQHGRVDRSYEVVAPQSSPGPWSLGASDSYSDEGAGGPSREHSDAENLLGPFRDEALPPSSLQNIRPAKQFPNPSVLRHGPLRRYFHSAMAGDSVWQAETPRTSPPWRAIGKLMIRPPCESAGVYASGSAFILGANTIVTCAHNLFDSNKRQWSTTLEFYPGYDFYSRHALPACRVISGVVPKAYLDNPLTNHDLAICRVDRNIGDQVGHELLIKQVDGIEFFEEQRVEIVGYPAGSGFDFGKQLWRCRGDFLFGLSGGGDDEFAPTLASDFGGGASGCPWVWYDAANDRWVAVGITSGHARLVHHPGEPNLLSLTSPLLTERCLDRLETDGVHHRFA